MGSLEISLFGIREVRCVSLESFSCKWFMKHFCEVGETCNIVTMIRFGWEFSEFGPPAQTDTTSLELEQLKG